MKKYILIIIGILCVSCSDKRIEIPSYWTWHETFWSSVGNDINRVGIEHFPEFIQELVVGRKHHIYQRKIGDYMIDVLQIHEHICYLMKDGEETRGLSEILNTSVAYPVFVDLDNDGVEEIVVYQADEESSSFEIFTVYSGSIGRIYINGVRNVVSTDSNAEFVFTDLNNDSLLDYYVKGSCFYMNYIGAFKQHGLKTHQGFFKSNSNKATYISTSRFCFRLSNVDDFEASDCEE